MQTNTVPRCDMSISLSTTWNAFNSSNIEAKIIGPMSLMLSSITG